MDGVLVIGVSQSGASPDVAQATARAREGGAITVAITNGSGSALAEAAELHLDLRAGPELAVAATKTYTAELLTLFLLVQAIASRDAGEAARIPELSAEVLRREPEIELFATRYRFADRLIVTSRGYNYATALEAALKLVEAARIGAQAFSAADLMHGPLAAVEAGFPVIVIAPEGAGGEALQPVIEKLDELCADVLMLGGRAEAAHTAISLPHVAEVVSPMIAIIPMQLFAFHLACQRSLDPDQPVGLTKVTETL
jgi:glucosamine--fructose-6-phosphate aminotransferase (isomerizing)